MFRENKSELKLKISIKFKKINYKTEKKLFDFFLDFINYTYNLYKLVIYIF